MGDTEHLRDRRFVGRSLRGSWFAGCDLGGVVIRGSDVSGLQVDSPWLGEAGAGVFVNGIDVVPWVNEQLDLAFPGRALRTADDPEGLRAAWSALERTWAATLAAPRDASVVDASVDGEWSLSQTLRHLVFATDLWLGRAVQRLEQPFHPLGLSSDDDGAAPDTAEPTPFDDVLAARAARQRQVREFLAVTTSEQLREPRPSPHDPTFEETVLSCVRTILEEEWEHHRYAVRDLHVLASPPA